MNDIDPRITGVILAGGQGSRMNHQDKPLLDLGGKAIVSHIIENAGGQVSRLLLNVNRNPDKYAPFELPVIGDCRQGYAGPLVGVLSAMKWCQQHDRGTAFIASFPGDVPWFPDDIVQQLAAALLSSGSEAAWVRSDGQVQPLFALWSMELANKLDAALQGNVYSPMQFLHSTRHVMLEINGGPDSNFLNINNPDDLEKARRLHRTIQS
ncbi:MAG: molybdenum cofactor guanylyltransferase MobA [Pseudohongiellaceae bacterium]